MRDRGALLALFAVLLAAVLAPAVALAPACPEDEPDDCCIPCGTRCSCCASAPRMALTSDLAGVHPALDAGRVDAGRLTAPPAPSPRDILHVPRSTVRL